jgi:phosphoserine phosphatase
MLTMPYVTTLISPCQVPFFDDAPLKLIKNSRITVDARREQAKDRAIDVYTSNPIPKIVMDNVRETFKIDIICQNADTRHKTLFMADMDATMVVEETLDELAAHAGIKDQIMAITARAMNGELDFKQALQERVKLLKGLPAQALLDTASTMTYTPGGALLLKTLKANNVYCVLVSGGFTYFTQKVADALGFNANHGNTLNISNNALDGTVAMPILDKDFKKLCLQDTAKKLKTTENFSVAIGDGANDLPMLEAAGLGVGFQAKPLLRDALPNHILYNGLDALIYALGLKTA